ncbi:hypothetical protein BaRGS_00023306 [Batillaria attramentaria]|uniref:Uncharacterized protein n=1 Tax=Batillaria attramentaria TaxID=370345 RepID=A0ABD0KEP4_9CAEN
MAIPWKACSVIAGGVLVHLTLGTLYTFGNLSPYMTSYIRRHGSPADLTYADSVWINAIAAMGQGTSMYFGGLLECRLGPRLTVLLGAWLQSLGVIMTYFTLQHSFLLTVFTYGAMFGLGIGIAYAVPLAVAMRWLPERKGLVNGFVVAGFGGGAFIFDQIQTAFINPNNEPPGLEVNHEKYFNQDDILDRVPKVFLLCGGCYAAMQLIGCLLLYNPPSYEVSWYLHYSPVGCCMLFISAACEHTIRKINGKQVLELLDKCLYIYWVVTQSGLPVVNAMFCADISSVPPSQRNKQAIELDQFHNSTTFLTSGQNVFAVTFVDLSVPYENLMIAASAGSEH